MNLLYTLTTYPPSTGGAQIHQHLLAQHLRPHHAIQVVSHWDANRTDWLLGTTLKAPMVARDYVIDDIAVHRMGLSMWDRLAIAPYVPIYYPLMDRAIPPIAHLLARHIRPFAEHIDLIHNVRIGREGLSYASLDLARQRNVPFMLTPVHHPRWRGWRYKAYDNLYRQADHLFALTHAEKEILVDIGVQPDRITVTGTGPVIADQANSQTFREQHQIDGPIVLFLAQHYRYKGFREVLQAAQLVWREIPEAHFVFIGPPVKRSEDEFKQHKDRRIHRLGRVNLQTKTDALAACDVLCVPSTQESFGIIYVEAWNFAKPVIGCSIPAVQEVITDGVDGYLVEQAPSQIADRLIDLLQNPARARAMGQQGQHKANELYTWPRIAQQTAQAYKRAIS